MNLLSPLINCLNANYGIAAATLTLLPLGADMNASVYKAETLDKQPYFVKLKHGHLPDISIRLLALLQASGIQETIPPIKTIDGKLTQDIDNCTLIVYPFVDGQNGFHHHLTDDQWVTLGKVLRQVHELDVPPSIKDQLRKETYSSKWRESVRSLDAYIDAEVAGDEIALKLRAFMNEHRIVIDRLLNRAEYLSQMIKGQSPEFVLCHSDIHAGNVLIDERGAIYIVDWDEPIMAPKECDLMFIDGGVANVWNNPREEELFYKGYGNTNINRVILAYYRHERIVKDIVEYGQALLLTSDGGENRLEMYKQFIDMFEPNGVVDIAFKTDEESGLKDKDIDEEKPDQIHIAKCVQDAEWDFAQILRSKYFFDPLAIQDPYIWTFDHQEHIHFILYQGNAMTCPFKESHIAAPAPFTNP